MDVKASAADGAEMPTASPPASGTVEERLAALRRMRLVATLLLVLMTLVFVATTAVQLDWPWIPYLRAFAEAGMVGACADWFAIVALFRRPLGLPIPHTGIVASNKDRIAKALGHFITTNFLTEAVLKERLARLDAVGAIADWLAEPANAKRLADYVAVVLPRVARALPGPQIGDSVGKLAQRALATIPVAPLASKMLAIVWAQGEAQAWLAGAIERGDSWLAANKDQLSDRISRHSWRWIPKWIDKMIADKVLTGMLTTLGEMRDPAHPWRVELRKAVEQLIVDLATNPQIQARAEGLKTELLASPLLLEQAKTLWAEIGNGINTGLPAHAEAIAQACEEALRATGAWLGEDAPRKQRLNRWLRAITQHFLSLYRFEIGAYIERVVHDWDSATLVHRLELQVGKDLQYIRINGTLVGGLVGLLIFIASKWIALF